MIVAWTQIERKKKQARKQSVPKCLYLTDILDSTSAPLSMRVLVASGRIIAAKWRGVQPSCPEAKTN